MTNYDVILETNYKSIIFHDKGVIFTDIDSIFRETNKEFSNILQCLNMNVSFDFSDKYHKTLYIHTFLKVILSHIEITQNKLCFYSNKVSKDPFRNSLIKKIKTIFGFKIFEDVHEFSEIVNRLQGCYMAELEVFFDKETKPKTFQHIKKYLEKTGLKMMNDVVFKDIANKMLILG